MCVHLESRFARFKVEVVVTLVIANFVVLTCAAGFYDCLIHLAGHDFAGALTICWLQLAWIL